VAVALCDVPGWVGVVGDCVRLCEGGVQQSMCLFGTLGCLVARLMHGSGIRLGWCPEAGLCGCPPLATPSLHCRHCAARQPEVQYLTLLCDCPFERRDARGLWQWRLPSCDMYSRGLCHKLPVSGAVSAERRCCIISARAALLCSLCSAMQ